jgi:hypothetical protein
MSQIKSILVIFNKTVELSDVEQDLIQMGKTNFFGLSKEKQMVNSIILDKVISIRTAFLKINESEYRLDVKYFPYDSDSIQCVRFLTDEFAFKEDLLTTRNTYDYASLNIRKLIRILKYKLNYYLMTLYFYDLDPLGPKLDHILEMQKDNK